MPLCLGTSGSVRAEGEDHVAVHAGAGPDLLAVEDPLVAVELGLAPEVGEIAAAVRLAVALAPHVGAVEDPRDVVLLLLLGAPVQDRVADHPIENPSLPPIVGTPALANSSLRMTCSRAVMPAPPYSAGQFGASRLCSLSTSRHCFCHSKRSSSGSAPMPFQSARQVFVEEVVHLPAERFALGGVGEVHAAQTTPRSVPEVVSVARHSDRRGCVTGARCIRR